ncbi:MAG TPA: ATP-binding protein [Methylomirabilota bacterium]|nr:ATP-binding protein [Methylomirabilota bacterium]
MFWVAWTNEVSHLVVVSVRLLGVLLLSSALIGLGLLVFLNNRRAQVNRLFGLSVISIVGWIVSITIALSLEDLNRSVVFGRLAFAFAGCIPFTLLLVFHAFPIGRTPPTSKAVVLPATLCLLFIALSFTSLIVSGAQRTNEKTNFVYGVLHPFFSAYVAGTMGFALYTLWRKLKLATGLKKLQLRYLLLGILLGAAGAVTTNVLIPLVWKTSQYSVLGPYFTLLLVSFSAHAIIRHRLMDIRLVVQRGFVFLLSVAAAGAIFVAIIAAMSTLTATKAQELSLALQVTVALAIALAFQPLKQRIQNALDRYLYRESYDYRAVIREASHSVASLLNLKSLVEYLCKTVSDTLRPDSVAVFVRDSHDRFDLVAFESIGDSEKLEMGQGLTSTAPLPTFLERYGRTLLRDDLGSSVTGRDAELAIEELVALGGDFAIPMMSEGELIGLLLVGPKRSGDPYFSDDLELLSTLSNQAVIAMRNAQLYRQVVLVNEYVENILATMESGVVATDSLRNVTLCNKAAERMTGATAGTLRSQGIVKLPEALKEPLEGTLGDGQPRTQIESALIDDAGRAVPIVCATSPLKDTAGALLGAVIVFSDLSRVKDLEREKRRGERLAAFGALASGIAHEIKNPLVAIRTFAELLPERFSEEDFRSDFSAIVLKEIERIDQLVARLRGLAVPSHQSFRSVDVIEPIEETLVLLRGQFMQKRIRINRAYGASRTRISGDSDQLKQLFLNLLINAVEAMEHDGEVTLRLADRATHDGHSLLVEITDSGSGIPEQLIGKVFEPFVTTKPKGSGLGLAICRGITDAHKGTIRVARASAEGGTTMLIEFPLVAEMEPATVR